MKFREAPYELKQEYERLQGQEKTARESTTMFTYQKRKGISTKIG